MNIKVILKYYYVKKKVLFILFSNFCSWICERFDPVLRKKLYLNEPFTCARVPLLKISA